MSELTNSLGLLSWPATAYIVNDKQKYLDTVNMTLLPTGKRDVMGSVQEALHYSEILSASNIQTVWWYGAAACEKGFKKKKTHSSKVDKEIPYKCRSLTVVNLSNAESVCRASRLNGVNEPNGCNGRAEEARKERSIFHFSEPERIASLFFDLGSPHQNVV